MRSALAAAAVLLAATALLVWPALRPRESWTFQIVGSSGTVSSGILEPRGDSVVRRQHLRECLHKAIRTLAPSSEGGSAEVPVLRLRIECTGTRQVWRWAWLPWEARRTINSMQTVSLYRMSAPGEAWQAGFGFASSAPSLGREAAVERLLDLTEEYLSAPGYMD